jgi:hypothetical protein
MKTLRKALIPAGGFGTRLLSATKAVPKELYSALRVSIIWCSERRIARTECTYKCGSSKRMQPSPLPAATRNGSYAEPPFLSVMAFMSSIGKGKMIVEFFS